jgi:hypothetical protein
MITAIKDLVEDLKRWRSDSNINIQMSEVYDKYVGDVKYWFILELTILFSSAIDNKRYNFSILSQASFSIHRKFFIILSKIFTEITIEYFYHFFL